MANFNPNRGGGIGGGGGGGSGNHNNSSNINDEMAMNIGANHHHRRGFPPPPAASSLQHGSLTRHSSLPAGFIGHSASGTPGFSITKGGGESYSSNRHEGGGPPAAGGYSGSSHHHNASSSSRRLSSSSSQQNNNNMSFTLRNPLDKISELAAAAAADEERLMNIDINSAGDLGHEGGSSSMISGSSNGGGGGFSIGPWDDGSDAFVYSTHSGKRAKQLVDPALLSTLSSFDSSGHQIDLSQAALDMGSLQIPEDSVPCKIRAKRGCATHPRSIAERERRTKISGKLKKLQELVPNMDKQTSYAEMLDLAVDHIKGLQDQIQKLNKEMERCTCGGCRRQNTG